MRVKFSRRNHPAPTLGDKVKRQTNGPGSEPYERLTSEANPSPACALKEFSLQEVVYKPKYDTGKLENHTRMQHLT